MNRFTKKTIIVTGSSKGIGAAIVDVLSNEGAKVIGLARTASEHSAPNYIPMNFDLGSASPTTLKQLIDDIIKKHGAISGLINNAGIIRRAPAVEYSESDWNDVIRINQTIPFFLTQALVKWWLSTGRAQSKGSRLKIVNIASLLSLQGGILVPAYTASKHAIAGLTKALANEWAPLDINVNAVAPGYVETDNTAALRADPVRSQSILSRIPQNAWAKPNDIAGACVFLASSDADYVNGAILNVDGGWLGR